MEDIMKPVTRSVVIYVANFCIRSLIRSRNLQLFGHVNYIKETVHARGVGRPLESQPLECPRRWEDHFGSGLIIVDCEDMN
jgi:hypothetical protein